MTCPRSHSRQLRLSRGSGGPGQDFFCDTQILSQLWLTPCRPRDSQAGCPSPHPRAGNPRARWGRGGLRRRCLPSLLSSPALEPWCWRLAGNQAGPLTFLSSQSLTPKAKSRGGEKVSRARGSGPGTGDAPPPGFRPPSSSAKLQTRDGGSGGGRGAGEEPSRPAQPQV